MNKSNNFLLFECTLKGIYKVEMKIATDDSIFILITSIIKVNGSFGKNDYSWCFLQYFPPSKETVMWVKGNDFLFPPCFLSQTKERMS